MRLGAPDRSTPWRVITEPTPEPTTVPSPSSPYSRLASRVSKTLEATIQPCDTSTMLNRLTQILNAYSIQLTFMPTMRHSTTRQSTANPMDHVTAAESDDFT